MLHREILGYWYSLLMKGNRCVWKADEQAAFLRIFRTRALSCAEVIALQHGERMGVLAEKKNVPEELIHLFFF